jgi:hypothetical protein
VSDVAPFKYRAFLSYSHRDTSWAKWLHRALEGYRIDKDLVGCATGHGLVPKTLRPIFRDREDFSAGHSLTEQTLTALEASQFLVVICSPNAARSPYVTEEVRRFKALGRAQFVIPVIVDGEPGDPQRECFPPALRFKLGADGGLTGEREEPMRPMLGLKGMARRLRSRRWWPGCSGSRSMRSCGAQYVRQNGAIEFVSPPPVPYCLSLRSRRSAGRPDCPSASALIPRRF